MQKMLEIDLSDPATTRNELSEMIYYLLLKHPPLTPLWAPYSEEPYENSLFQAMDAALEREYKMRLPREWEYNAAAADPSQLGGTENARLAFIREQNSIEADRVLLRRLTYYGFNVVLADSHSIVTRPESKERDRPEEIEQEEAYHLYYNPLRSQENLWLIVVRVSYKRYNRPLLIFYKNLSFPFTEAQNKAQFEQDNPYHFPVLPLRHA